MPEATPPPGPDEQALRAVVRSAVGATLTNVSNFPVEAQASLWGANLSKPLEKITDAVVAAVLDNAERILGPR